MIESLIAIVVRPHKTICIIVPINRLAIMVGPMLFVISLYSYKETKSILKWYSLLLVDYRIVFVIQCIVAFVLLILVLPRTYACLHRMAYIIMGIDTIWMALNIGDKYVIFIDEYSNRLLCFDYLLRLIDEVFIYILFTYILYCYYFIIKI
jgi:hypothetical protein